MGGVVEDHPARTGCPLRERLGQITQCCVVIVAVVHAGRAMPSPVAPSGITARLGGLRNPRRVRADTPDRMPLQHRIGLRCEPAGMAWLADHRYSGATAQHAEEAGRHPRIECMARRQLQQHPAELAAQPGRLLEEAVQRRTAAAQGGLVRDGFGQLHRKAERGRHARRPAFIGALLVWTIEGGVDLHHRKACGITRQHALAVTGQRRIPAGNGPACASDPD